MTGENPCMRLLRTSHLGPSVVVALVGFLLAKSIWTVGPSLVIAAAVFSGQLCIGWTNDLIDLESDRTQSRKNKPLAVGSISVVTVRTATIVVGALCIPLSLFGPMGLRGGSVHLLGVASGLSYDFYFKRTRLSPLPFIIAFAALPSAIVLSKNHTVPYWLISAGGLFGVAAHFANVVKDMDRDREAGLRGLPQILGTRASLLIAGTSLLIISVLLANYTHVWIPVPVSAVAVLLLLVVPIKYCFPLVMGLALADVAILVSRVSL